MVNKDLIEFLNSLDWNDIIKRLTAYCDWKIRAGKWWRRDTEELAKGFKPIYILLMFYDAYFYLNSAKFIIYTKFN